MSSVYLDYCASSPLHPAARTAMLEYLERSGGGNPSSVHGHGRQAEAMLSRARCRVADLIAARASEIVFTSSGTEANHLAILGAVESARAQGRDSIHVITSAVEHESVLALCQSLESKGVQVSYLPVGSDGQMDLIEVEALIRPETALITTMLVNHETGCILPVEALGTLARTRGVPMHVDASMAIGRIEVDVARLGVDLLTMSGHKFGAPKGVGALYAGRGYKLVAQTLGGPQERKRRAGTENLIGILGMGAVAGHLDVSSEGPRLERLSKDLLERLSKDLLNVHYNGSLRGCPGIVNISIEGVEGQSVLMNLDIEGISVSSGTPCSSGSLEPSKVLLAMGLGEQRARESLRFSFGHASRAEDVDRVAEVLPPMVERLRAINV